LLTDNLKETDLTKKIIKVNLNVKLGTKDVLPNNLKLFLSRFYPKLKEEFRNQLSIEINEEKVNSKNIKKETHSNPTNTLKFPLESLESYSKKDFLASLNFTKNYNLILTNMFPEDQQRHKDSFNQIRNILESKVHPFVLKKLKKKKKKQNRVSEVVLTLFLAHLDVPESIRSQLKDSFLLTVYSILFFMMFEAREVLPFVKQLPTDLFNLDTLFDIEFESHLDDSFKKEIYFCMWYLYTVMRNFHEFLLVLDTCSEKKVQNDAFENLFWFPEITNKQFDFTLPLSLLIRSIKINQLQQFFIFLKNEFHENIFPKENNVSQKNKKLYFYLTPNRNQIISFSTKSLNLNSNPFHIPKTRKSKKAKNSHNKESPWVIPPSLKKSRRPQEICNFIGSRLKTHFTNSFFQTSDPQSPSEFLLSVSTDTFHKFRESEYQVGPLSPEDLPQINYFLNKKVFSTYKTPMYLLQSIMCTQQYQTLDPHFYEHNLLVQETERLFHKMAVLDRGEDKAVVLKRLFGKSPKFPCSVIGLLNQIGFVKRLAPTIDFGHFLG
jgi:hypothetical protein